MNLKNIKRLSKQINKNKYHNALTLSLIGLIVTTLFCIIPYLISKIFNETPGIYLPLLIIASSAYYAFHTIFKAGENAWYSGRITRTKKCYKKFIFWLKPRYAFKAIRLRTTLLLLKTIITFLLISPAIFTIMFAVSLAFTGGIEAALFAGLISGGIILTVIGVTFAFIINQQFFLAKYLLSDNPKLGVIQVIKQSKNLTEGQIHDIIKFRLSFMPFFLLTLFIFPLIYIYPHYKQSSCIIAKELRL